MAANTPYKDILMDHYRHPRNRGDVGDADVITRGSNPRCGDDIELGVSFDGGRLQKVVFHGRGCSVCLASASMMTEEVTNMSVTDAQRLYHDMKAWFSNGGGDVLPEPPASLQALAAVREYPARRRCVLLAWEALNDALVGK